MYAYVLLFRGINVGGNGILPMKELAEILQCLGYKSIKTYIQSGNVILKHDQPMGQKQLEEIGSVIEERKGFKPQIFLLEKETFQEIMQKNPFADQDKKTVHVFLLKHEPDPERVKILNTLLYDGEKFELTGNACYFYAPHGIGRSKWASQFEKKIQVSTTARNWNTWLTLAKMLEETP